MRSPRSKGGDTSDLKKGAWTSEEDKKLVDYIVKHGQGSWQLLPKKAGLNRCGKSCRLRWTNYLRPDIKRGNFSPHEDQTIIDLHSLLGNKWSAIAARLPGRTDNEIKNYWNTHLRKRLIQSGIDPNTHQPITYPILPDFNIADPMNTGNLAKLGILCSILQILKTNNNYPFQVNNINNNIPLGRLEMETLNLSQQAKYPFQAASSSMAAVTDDPWHDKNQPFFDTTFEMMPKLEDDSISKGITPDESFPAGEVGHGDTVNVDELEQMLNYKDMFGPNKSFQNDVWGELVDNDGEQGTSCSSWKDVFSELFPAL